MRRAGPTPVSAEGCCCCFFVSAMLCRGRVPQLGEEPGLPAPVSAEAWVFVCVCAPAMLCHDRVYQRGELGLPTPVSVEGWHVVYLPSGVMTGYPKEGAGPTHTCISGGMACCVPAIWCHDRIPQGGSWAYPSILYLLSCVIAGYPKEEKSWAYPHLCQWRGGGVVPAMLCTCCLVSWQGTPRRRRTGPTHTCVSGGMGGGGGCTCHVVYLLSCVMAGYPKEEKNWAYPHLCQWRDGGGVVPAMLCTCCLVSWQGTLRRRRTGPTHTCVSGGMEREWGVIPAMLCTCCLVSWQGTPRRRRAGPTHTCVSGGMEKGGGVVPAMLCTCCLVSWQGTPRRRRAGPTHTCVSGGMERGGGGVVPAMLCTCCLVSWQGTPRRRRAGPTHTCVSGGMEGGGVLYLPCCVPVVLCHGRVPQGGEELGLPTPVSADGRGV